MFASQTTITASVLLLPLHGACGQVAPIPTDAAEPSARCAPGSPFNPPLLVTGLAASGTERTAQFSPNELTVYFSGVLPPSTSYDIYEARRSSSDAPFQTPTRMQVSSDAQDFAPSISPDGATLIFTSDREGGADHYQLFVAARTSNLASFDSVSKLAGVTPPGATDVTTPSISGDGQELWFVAHPGIWRASFSPNGTSPPIFVSEIGPASFPVISTDRLTLYFASTRPGSTSGSGDIWFSHRDSAADPFPPPVLVSGVNSEHADAPTWLSPDDCRLYLESDRSGTMDIYVASRTP